MHHNIVHYLRLQRLGVDSTDVTLCSVVQCAPDTLHAKQTIVHSLKRFENIPNIASALLLFFL